MNALKNIGSVALGLVAFVAISFVVVLLFEGTAAVGRVVMPWLALVSWLTLGVCVLVLLPLSAFRASRFIACWGFLVASYVFGISVWTYGFLVTYDLWGVFGVVVGLVIVGVGVVPIAIIAAIFHGLWSLVFELVALVILTYGSRALALALAQKIDRDAVSTMYNLQEIP